MQRTFSALLSLFLFVLANHALAQNTLSNADLLKELSAMRARIDQLETELRRRDAASAALATSPAVPTDVARGPASTDSTAAEPFAFADWTWLNGNPRTKEAAFDSKFFTPEVRADV